jgi:autotransporter translocation and assembly factor TamB
VTLRAEAPNDLSTLTANLTVTQISPLAEFEPIINGKARVALRRTGRKWTGDIVVSQGTVFVPESVADDLLEADDPGDVYFVEKPPPESLFRRTREPSFTWLDARIRIEPTSIRVPEYGVTAAVKTSDLRLLVGDTIGLEGKIYVERGAADDIFGRRYQIERNAIVTFERTLDPVVDLAMASQIRDLLLNVKVQGKPSDADFPKLTFASDPPGRYTEGELFGFFLGGEPGGDSSAQAKEAGLGVGASVLSQYVARQVKKYLPKRLTFDVMKCDAATASCTLGKRFLDDELYIAYRRRIGALPNENADEAQIQYYLSREWFLEGVGGSANIIGADLLWRRRW